MALLPVGKKKKKKKIQSGPSKIFFLMDARATGSEPVPKGGALTCSAGTT